MPYDPYAPEFFDTKAGEQELARVTGICESCRRCYNLCPSFDLMFGRVDAHEGDVAQLTSADYRRIVDLVNRFLGLDRECVMLEIGPCRVPARFEEGKSPEERMSAVHFVRFALPPEARQALADPVQPLRLTVDHSHYQARQDVPPETRRELLADLGGA